MPGGRPSEKYSQALRILKIYTSLMFRSSVTIPELMQEYGVNRRTIQRDLAILGEAYALAEGERTPQGEKTFHLINRNAKGEELHVLRVSVLELIVLFMGRNLFAFTEGTDLAKSWRTLYEKLQTHLEDRNVALQGSLQKKLYCTTGFPKHYAAADDVVNELISSLIKEHKVAMTYRPPHKRSYDDVLHPYSLVVHNHALYVLGRSERAGALRMFAVERIVEAARRKGDAFEYPEDFDPQEHFSEAFGVDTGQAGSVDVRLLFDESVAPYVAARRWHPSQAVKARRDGRLELTMKVAVTEELEHWLTGYGGAVEIAAPRELRARIATRHRAGLGRAGRRK
jgi:predicted DNA-binding transcriptional regulator YafY